MIHDYKHEPPYHGVNLYSDMGSLLAMTRPCETETEAREEAAELEEWLTSCD